MILSKRPDIDRFQKHRQQPPIRPAPKRPPSCHQLGLAFAKWMQRH